MKLEVGGSVPGQPVKVILRGVSGAALPGELVALVGPSGIPYLLCILPSPAYPPESAVGTAARLTRGDT